MKKILLIMAVGLLFITNLTAQQQEPLWEKTKAIARETGKEVTKEHLAISSNGDVYAAGRFSVAFSFAGNDLEPIANSSYLTKYNLKGEETWGVSIAGAAAVTGITLDENGNVFLIGRLADKVVFNTTSGTAITKTSNARTDLSSAFVAKYSPAGEVLAVEVFVPAEQNIDYDVYFGFYDPTPEFYFSNIQVSGGKVYVSALLKGDITNNEIKLTSKIADLWGIGYYVDLQAGYVLSLTSDLKFESVVSEMSATENFDINKIDVFDATFAIENNVMFLGYVADGNQTLKVGTNTKELTLSTPEGEAWEYVYQLAAYNIDTKTTVLLKDYIVAHDAGYNRCRLSKITPVEDGIIVEGTYNGAPLAFDNTLTHLGANDVFAVKLNKSDLTVIKAFTSGIDEGDVNKNEEVLISSAMLNDILLQIILTDVVGENPIATFIVMSEFKQDSNITMEADPGFFATGLAINSRYASIAAVNPATSTMMYNLIDYMTSNVKNQYVTEISIYPNPVTDMLNFTEVCDVKIIGISGNVVKSAKQISSLNITELAPGIYFVNVTNNKGSDTVKIIKK